MICLQQVIIEDYENLTATIVYVFDRDLRSRGPSFSKFVKNVFEVTEQVYRFGYVNCKYICFLVLMFVRLVLW